jgi:preprotein translocase subunit SecE
MMFLAQIEAAKPSGPAAWVREHPVLAVVYAVVVGLTLYFGVRHRERIVRFVRETRAELAKCNWPWDSAQKGTARYRELIDSTIIVIVAMVLLGAYTSAFDLILMRATGLILGH